MIHRVDLRRAAGRPGAVFVGASLVALVLASAVPAAAASATGEVPRMPDGKPDLTGTYDIATLTPLTRPRIFGDKLYLTEEEANEIAAKEAEVQAKQNEASDPNRERPPEGGVDVRESEHALDATYAGAAGQVGGYNSFWIDRGAGVFEIDGKFRTSIVNDPPDGQLPKMTPAAMQRVMEARKDSRPNDGTAYWLENEGPGPYDGPETRPLADRCLLAFGSGGGPPALPVLYNNLKRIVQTEDSVMILNEMVHDARIVKIVDQPGAEHAAEAEELEHWLGDSVGWWEGDTLVVQTKGFRDEPGLFMASSELEVEERFTRLADGNLRYRFTVNDPNTWSAPWSGEYPWRATEDHVYEYACHEGNYAMGNILRGARILEAEAEGRPVPTFSDTDSE